jgi:cell division control protein 6
MPTSANIEDLLRRLSRANIFKDREKLRPDYLPENLPHRENQILRLAEILLSPIARGARPSNVFIYGYTGTGKTAVIKHVLKWLERKWGYNNTSTLETFLYSRSDVVRVITTIVNCRTENTNYRILRALLGVLGVEVPFTGLSVAELYDRFIEVLEKNESLFVVALDEIDQLIDKSGDELLYRLTRINSELTRSKVTIIGITNSLNLRDYLDPRVKSSLGEEELVFPPYNALELEDILKERAELAFQPGVLDPGVISLCASLAAREHGDARRALDLLRVAGEIAEREGAQKVTENHVKLALKDIEKDKTVEVIRTLPLHSKLVLISVYLLWKQGISASTGEVYDMYCRLVQRINLDPLTQRRVSDIISELDMIGLVQAKLMSKGRYGRTKYITLAIPEKAMLEGIKDDSRLSAFV